MESRDSTLGACARAALDGTTRITLLSGKEPVPFLPPRRGAGLGRAQKLSFTIKYRNHEKFLILICAKS